MTVELETKCDVADLSVSVWHMPEATWASNS
jgi:hypothetical protein